MTRTTVTLSRPEASETFACFGSHCSVHVLGDGGRGTATEAVRAVRHTLLGWHERFTRFSPSSELSRLNADTREEVPVSAVMAQFVAVALEAAAASGGLVDPTLIYDLEAAGYERDLSGSPVPLDLALELAPPRGCASPSGAAAWRDVSVDTATRVVRRPPGVGIDSGGIAKGFFADVLSRALGAHAG
jgi:thiamine biosynthesis lipoprotein